jgi:small subunit ribosomal protein S18
MAQKKQKRKKIRLRPVETDCIFCEKKVAPDYKDYKTLEHYLSDRAKILGRDRTGVCNKHQRMLPVQIKRARHLGLLPYAQTV